MKFYDTKSPVPPEAFNAETLGGKGYGLVWMTNNGINVPPAVIIPTDVCVAYMKKPKTVMKEIAKEYDELTGFFIDHFGYMPLLSVRSGARVSMPGMLDTILNVGLDHKTEPFWKEKLGETCAIDCVHRLKEMYGTTALGFTKEAAQQMLAMPTAKEQVLNSIEAVFKSWNNERAKFYRKMHNIPEEWGTAVILQAMVFGNMGDTSATGVLFTRDPDTGADFIKGEFLVNAQGEDVVAGVRTPEPLAKMADWNINAYLLLLDTVKKMEDLKGDVQDVEFTVQDGVLYILQTRNAKRTPLAAIKIAVDYVKEGKLTRLEALKRIKIKDYDAVNQDVVDPSFTAEPAFTGIPACSGVVSGRIVLTSEAAKESKEPCVLVTKETTPDDIEGMFASVGIITMEGGATSHAAVVARGMNKPCVVGVSQPLNLFPEGAMVSFDGATGRVWLGLEVPVVKGTHNPVLAEFEALLFNGNVVSVDHPVAKKVLINGNPYYSDAGKLAQLIAEAVSHADEVYVDLTGADNEHVDKFNMIFYPDTDKSALRHQLVLDLIDLAMKTTPGIVNVITSAPGWKPKNVKLLAGTFNWSEFILSDGGFWVGDLNPAVEKLMDLKQKAGEKCGVLGVYDENNQCFQSKSSLMARLLA